MGPYHEVYFEKLVFNCLLWLIMVFLNENMFGNKAMYLRLAYVTCLMFVRIEISS